MKKTTHKKGDKIADLLFCFMLIVLGCISACKEQNKGNNIKHTNQNSQATSYTIPDTPLIEKPPSTSNRKPVFTQYHTNLDGMVNEFVRKLFQDKKGHLWFGTNGDGIIHYNGKSLEQFTTNDGLGGNAIREIVEDKNGNLWFGTSGGLTKYDGESFTNFSKNEGLINNEIWSVAIDHKGAIWVGTVEGLSVFDGKAFHPFSIPKANVNVPEPLLSKNRVSKILEDRNNNLWFVIDGYGISIYNPEATLKSGKKIVTYFTKANGLPDNNVADLLEDRNGNIWIGSYYGGVSRYDGKTVINYTQNGVIKGVETYNFCEDKKGNIWFSAENVGVYSYDGNSFSKFSKQNGLATNGVQSIYEDNKGQLWFGTWSGLSIYDGHTFLDAKEKEPWTK